MFKPKSAKKIKFNKNALVTITTKHDEFLAEFAKDENDITHFQHLIQSLKDKLIHHCNDLSVEETLDIKDQIKELKENIKKLKWKKKDYYLNNSKYIFEYFETKKNLSDGNSSSQPANSTKSKLINDFFKITNEPTTQDASTEECGGDEEGFLHSSRAFQKNHNIVSKYLTNVSDDFFNMEHFVYQTDICTFCHKGEMSPIEEEGILICNYCSRHIPYLVENEKPSYKEPPKESRSGAYKKINHFKEVLAQFQAKETTQIKPEIIANIEDQIKKERIDKRALTYKKTKDILKKLEYNKYYEHIYFIMDKLGISPPLMSPELEETLCTLFIEIQPVYAQCRPNNKVNFLNYYYTAYKLCEHLGETAYLPFFPMLKDPDKIIEQDVTWKKMCKILGWTFRPTTEYL